MISNPQLLTFAPKPGTVLCSLDDINDPGAKGFVFGKGAERFDMFIVRKNDVVHGYVNSCPHLRTPLEFVADKFLNKRKSSIMCSTHGARFRIADGYCFAGPCVGASLVTVPLELGSGQIKIGGTKCKL